MNGQDSRPELVFLPRPSLAPAGLAVGIALLVVGLWGWWPYAAAGAIAIIVASLTWIRGNRDEIAQMPREQRPFTTAGLAPK